MASEPVLVPTPMVCVAPATMMRCAAQLQPFQPSQHPHKSHWMAPCSRWQGGRQAVLLPMRRVWRAQPGEDTAEAARAHAALTDAAANARQPVQCRSGHPASDTCGAGRHGGGREWGPQHQRQGLWGMRCSGWKGRCGVCRKEVVVK